MKRNVCWLSTLRQPAHTLFLLLLVGLISFSSISRAVEYLVVNRETDRLAGYYRAIGTLKAIETVRGRNYDVSEGTALVSQSKYVAFEDHRRFCSGVLQGIYNADLSGATSDHAYDSHRVNPRYAVYSYGLYTSDVLVYGELRSKAYAPQISTRPDEYHLVLQVDRVVAGYPEYVQPGNSIRVRWLIDDPKQMEELYAGLQVGERYFLRAYYNPTFNETIGRKVLWDNASQHLALRPLNDSGRWFLPVTTGADVDFSDPSLAELVQLQRVTEENRHAMRVLGTQDMSAMPSMQESARLHYLAEGRWLDRQDYINGNRVCVVHQSFAEIRGLSVGDAISLTLRDLQSPHFGYIVLGEDWDSWQEYETYTVEFEIVGLYGQLLEYAVSSDFNDMYIPDSCMPAGFGRSPLESGVHQSYYSFVLRSLEDEAAFLAENQERLAKMGFQVTILENGWENFRVSATAIRHSTAHSAAFFALLLVLTLALTSFLYLWQRRRDFAILRSLGVPRRIAVKQTLLPIAIIGAVAMLLGGLPAWFYALSKAGKALATLQGPRVAEPAIALSPFWLLGLCTMAFSLLLAFTGAGLSSLARRPVLELLQGAAQQAGNRKKVTGSMGGSVETGALGRQASSVATVLPLGESLVPSGKADISHAVRFVLRHIWRAPLRSILTIALAICFVFALGWLNLTMERNEAELDRLYVSTQVEAEIVPSSIHALFSAGFIRKRTVDTILRSGFVESAYLEAVALTPLMAPTDEEGEQDMVRAARGVFLRGLPQLDWFVTTKGSDIQVQYAGDWDESLFAKDWSRAQVRPAVLPVSLLARMQLKPEDTFVIANSFTGRVSSFIVAGYYTGIVKKSDPEPVLLPLSALEQLEKDELYYDVARFVFDREKNRELPEFRAQMEQLFREGIAGKVKMTLILWDEELTQVVEPLEKNLSLITLLYTVTVIVSVLIAAGLATLLLFQSARDAAIMRVLGTTKSRARAMLCGEYLLLCLVGLVVGLSILVALRQDVVAVLQGPALVCAGLYLAGASGGALYSAIAVTNRMPLELLQVKE